MTAALQRVILCAPEAAGWNDPARADGWRELGYQWPANGKKAAAQHDILRRRLEEAGVEPLLLPAAADLSPDAVYAHDASIITDRGAVVLRMGKAVRAAEPARHAAFYGALGVPIVGAIEEPGTIEAGDIVWIDRDTLLVGRGYRTSAAGIAQLRDLMGPLRVEVIEAPLPHGPGPDACLHLMSLLSLLDARTALVDLAWLSVPTVEVLRGRGYDLVPIDTAERDTLACNVLALGDGRLLALEENSSTNRTLKERGFDVRTFPGRDLGINGGGGPTCLTRPLLRR